MGSSDLAEFSGAYSLYFQNLGKMSRSVTKPLSPREFWKFFNIFRGYKRIRRGYRWKIMVDLASTGKNTLKIRIFDQLGISTEFVRNLPEAGAAAAFNVNMESKIHIIFLF